MLLSISLSNDNKLRYDSTEMIARLSKKREYTIVNSQYLLGLNFSKIAITSIAYPQYFVFTKFFIFPQLRHLKYLQLRLRINSVQNFLIKTIHMQSKDQDWKNFINLTQYFQKLYHEKEFLFWLLICKNKTCKWLWYQKKCQVLMNFVISKD